MPTTDIGRRIGVPGGEAFAAGLLEPNQQAALAQLIQQLSSGSTVQGFSPGFNVGLSNLEQTSLQALEERALNLESPSPLNDAMQQVLLRAMNPDQAVQDTSNYFETNIQAPALRSFQEQVLPQIGRSFGGADFFSSERAGADNQARQELVTALTQSRADIQYKAYEAAQQRALQAVGLTQAGEQQQFAEEQALYSAGQDATNRQVAQRDKEYGEFVRQQEAKSQERQQLLGAISIPTKENIVAQKGAKQKTDWGGIISGAGAVIGGLAMFSDRNMKDEVKETSTPVLDALAKMPSIKTWKYKKGTGISQERHIGAMAQDFKKAFGVGDGKTINVVDAVGVIMAGLQEYANDR